MLCPWCEYTRYGLSLWCENPGAVSMVTGTPVPGCDDLGAVSMV